MAKNESKNPAKEYSVGGYTFKTKEGAQAAKDELAAIKYMSSKTDSTNAKQVYILYHDIIDKKLFNTLIGMNYLKELQQFLYLSPDVPNEKIRPIPINNETKEISVTLSKSTKGFFGSIVGKEIYNEKSSLKGYIKDDKKIIEKKVS